MSNLVKQEPGVLTEFNKDQLQILKNKICASAPNDKIIEFVVMTKARKLDPLSGQVVLVPRKDNKSNKINYIQQTTIDGYRSIAAQSGCYGGIDEPEYKEGKSNPEIARVTVHRIVQGQRVPFVGVARWSEFYPGDKMGMIWRKYPHTMLAKCAEAQALRKAFPVELGKVYLEEEFQNDKPVIATQTEKVEQVLLAEKVESNKADPKRIEMMLIKFAELGLDESMVLKRLEYTSRDQVTEDDLAELIDVYQALLKEKQSEN